MLVKIEAPGCSSCSKYAPIFLEMATFYTAHSNIQFYNINGLDNEVEGLSPGSFPTLFYFRHGEWNNPIRLTGHIDRNKTISFIMQHSTTKIPNIDGESIQNRVKEDL